jgi:hypothetical protein
MFTMRETGGSRHPVGFNALPKDSSFDSKAVEIRGKCGNIREHDKQTESPEMSGEARRARMGLCLRRRFFPA